MVKDYRRFGFLVNTHGSLFWIKMLWNASKFSQNTSHMLHFC
jgi:hypothetical protein